ncbi:ArsR family transcriptional regulator [Niallia taxi]|nr:ArsR family transcriptional regulator [Niallia taxi]MDE5055138.1 ArsR family transcriptional regulator [Niallia taxi]
MNKDVQSLLSDENIKGVSRLCKVLTNPTRIKILSLIYKKDLTINQISDRLKLSNSLISNQINYLKNSKYIECKKGTENFYRHDDEKLIGTINQLLK